MYPSERAKITERDFGGEFTNRSTPPRSGAEHLANVPDGRHARADRSDRNRIFNLGYYTWVEQQGTPFELFEARRHQTCTSSGATPGAPFRDGHRGLPVVMTPPVPAWRCGGAHTTYR
jgi:hypothetical protein